MNLSDSRREEQAGEEPTGSSIREGVTLITAAEYE
jgi:hypothetical protein